MKNVFLALITISGFFNSCDNSENTMTIQLQENKKIAVTYIEEVVNNRKLHLIDEIFFPDYTSHEKNGNDENNIKDGSLPSCLEYLFKAFPDLHYKVIDVIADIRKPFR